MISYNSLSIKTIVKSCTFLLTIFSLTVLTQSFSIAKADWPDCSDSPYNVRTTGLGESVFIDDGTTSHTFKFNSGNLSLDDNYYVVVTPNALAGIATVDHPKMKGGESDYLTITQAQQDVEATITDNPSSVGLTYTGAFRFPSNHNNPEDTQHVYLYQGNIAITGPLCKLGVFKLKNVNSVSCTSPVTVYQNRTVNGEQKKCYGISRQGQSVGCLDQTSPLFFEIDGVQQNAKPYDGSLYLDLEELFIYRSTQKLSPGNFQAEVGPAFWGLLNHPVGTRNVAVYVPNQNGVETKVPGCDASFSIVATCGEEQCQTTPPTAGVVGSYELCNQILDTALQEKCRTCATEGVGGDSGQGGVWTAVGCISRNPVDIAQRLIQVGLGMGGGVALIMTLAGGFILSTSQGDPQKANQAREMITNSVIGLLFVIFSVVILQFIGVTILRIPGFGADTQQTTAP